MAYSKSPRPYRRYSVLTRTGKLYSDIRAHDTPHAKKLAEQRYRREMGVGAKPINLSMEVFEGTVRRATS